MTELIYTMITTHITIMCVTLFLHRNQAHQSVKFHKLVSHFFRFWLWLTTGMVTREWVAVHRLHHQKTDTELDPHSPKIRGVWTVLFSGAFLYRQACQDGAMIQKLGTGTPNDWMERHVYSKYAWAGVLLLLVLNCWMFGWWGVMCWLVQMLWVPFWAAGVINGVAHTWGYRNGDPGDTSTNLLPWGVVIGGEELHNNHHLSPTSAKFSRRWWEFDIGWLYIRVLQALGLAQVRV